MDQERALQTYKEQLKLLGQIILKGMYLVGNKAYDEVNLMYAVSKAAKQPLGEQDWETFMKRPENKELKTFWDNEVNIEHLKGYLKNYGVDFAIQKDGDGRVKLLFASKDTAVVTQAFEDLVKDLITEGKGINKKLLKTPKNMSFQEKLAYQTQRSKEAIRINKERQVKAPTKVVRNEVVKS